MRLVTTLRTYWFVRYNHHRRCHYYHTVSAPSEIGVSPSLTLIIIVNRYHHHYHHRHRH